MTSAAQVRGGLVDFLERDLIGPAGGPHEVLDDSPRIRYLAGVLFPQGVERNESEAAGGAEGDTPTPALGDEADATASDKDVENEQPEGGESDKLDLYGGLAVDDFFKLSKVGTDL